MTNSGLLAVCRGRRRPYRFVAPPLVPPTPLLSANWATASAGNVATGTFSNKTTPTTGVTNMQGVSGLTALQIGNSERLKFVNAGTSPIGPSPRVGSYSLRAECRYGDYNPSGTDRTQLSTWAAPIVAFTEGLDFWFAMSLWVDATVATPTSGKWKIFHQFWSTGGSPPIGVSLSDTNNLNFVVQPGSRTTATHTIASGGGVRGTWHDLLMHIVLSNTASGAVDLFHRAGTSPAALNSVSFSAIWNDSGANLPVDGTFVYVQPSVYRSRPVDVNETDVVFYGGLKADETQAVAESLWA